tara:strand:+ start:181 stop:399 length:219 start_codon:yes stop_codon:yes gene_type:complete
MAKISVHLGFTFRVGPLDRNQYGRVDLTVDQIDTSLPLEPQLEEAEGCSDKVWGFVKNKVDTQIEEILETNE